jgi:hypothetical protein
VKTPEKISLTVIKGKTRDETCCVTFKTFPSRRATINHEYHMITCIKFNLTEKSFQMVLRANHVDLPSNGRGNKIIFKLRQFPRAIFNFQCLKSERARNFNASPQTFLPLTDPFMRTSKKLRWENFYFVNYESIHSLPLSLILFSYVVVKILENVFLYSIMRHLFYSYNLIRNVSSYALLMDFFIT